MSCNTSDKGITVHNSPPKAQILSHNDLDEELINEVISFSGIISDNNHDYSKLEAKWTSNYGELCPFLPIDEDGISYCDAVIPTGDGDGDGYFITLLGKDPTSATGEDTIDIVLVNSDGPPSEPVVSINPNPAYTESNLTISPSGSVDPEGSTVTYQVEWTKDGETTEETSMSISSDLTNKGEEWRVTVTPSDGTVNGFPAEDSIIISNTPPTVSSIEISPTTDIGQGTTLICSITVEDPDEEPSINYEWKDQNNTVLGTEDSLILQSPQIGDEITCTAVAIDSDNESASDSISVIVDQAEDCAGISGGLSTVDECGICDADPTNDCSQLIVLYSASSNGNMGGRTGADAICDTEKSNHSNLINYTAHALLCIDGPSEAPNFPSTLGIPSNVDVVSLDGSQLAVNWAALMLGMNETLEDANVMSDWQFFTGCQGSLSNCVHQCSGSNGPFSSMDPGTYACVGKNDDLSSQWLAWGNILSCEVERSFLCLAYGDAADF